MIGVKSPHVKWITGLFEGEGSIRISQKKNGHNRLWVRLSNTNLDLIEPLRPFGNTSVYLKKGNRQKIYEWRAVGQEGANFLKMIKPYIVSDRNVLRIQVAIGFQKIVSSGHFHTEDEKAQLRYLCHEMTLLNRRGKQ